MADRHDATMNGHTFLTCEICGDLATTAQRTTKRGPPVRDPGGRIWPTRLPGSRWYFGCDKHPAWILCQAGIFAQDPGDLVRKRGTKR